MEPKHHSKIMIVIVVLVVVVVLGLGVAAIFGKRKAVEQSAIVDTRTEEEKLSEQMTAVKHYSLDDPEIIGLKPQMSAPKLVLPSAKERASLVGSMSAVEI